MSKGMVAMMHSADQHNPARMLTFSIHLPIARYDTAQKQAAWYQQSLDKLRSLPGVQHAEVTTVLPHSDFGWLDDCEIENHPHAPGRFQSALRLPVSDGYFSALNIPMISGRGFTGDDTVGSQPVAIVSRQFVARYFPGESPLGRRIRMGSTPKNQTLWLTIVGVVDEVNYFLFLPGADSGEVYLSAAQMPPAEATYAVITNGDPMSIAATARKALAQIDPALPLDGLETYAEYMREKLIGLAYVAVMLGSDALIALLLAAIGIFGVMANMVGERTREIGVRLAMGARREDVLRMILRRATWITATGLAMGLLLASGLAHGVASLLYGVSPNDLLVFSVIPPTIALIALGSSWIPARRAARIDPMVALHDE